MPKTKLQTKYSECSTTCIIYALSDAFPKIVYLCTYNLYLLPPTPVASNNSELSNSYLAEYLQTNPLQIERVLEAN